MVTGFKGKKKSRKSPHQQFQEFWLKVQWGKSEKGKLPKNIHVLWNYFIDFHQDNIILSDPTKPKLPKNIKKRFEQFSEQFFPDPAEDGYQVCVSFLNAFKEARLRKNLRPWIEGFIEVNMTPHPHEDVHRLYHTFEYIFKDEEGYAYMFKGLQLIQKIEKFVKDYPNEGMEIVSCDDSSQTSSIILFIPHKSLSQFWGVTAVFVPQNSWDPIEFFFNLDAVDNVILRLQSIIQKF